MSTSRHRNPVSVTRAKKLPPIREETFRYGSPQPASRWPETHYSVRRKSSPVLNLDLTRRGNIHVRPLPRKTEEKREPNPSYRPKPSEPSPRLSKQPMAPLNVNHTLVDGIVADYLHFAKYGHIIPVYEGTGTSSCPCCTDRNRENVRTLLGFPQTEQDVKKEAWRSPRDNMNVPRSEVGPHPKPLHADYNWLQTQPMPYATNYLNPEFNRPSVVYNYLNERRDGAQDSQIKSTVLSASASYEDSMRKLEKFGL